MESESTRVLKEQVKAEREFLFGRGSTMKPMMLSRPKSIRRPEDEDPVEDVFDQSLGDRKRKSDLFDASGEWHE